MSLLPTKKRALSGEPSERSERPERKRGRQERCNAMLGANVFARSVHGCYFGDPGGGVHFSPRSRSYHAPSFSRWYSAFSPLLFETTRSSPRASTVSFTSGGRGLIRVNVFPLRA